VLGDSQECHNDHDKDHGDSLRLLAHHLSPFCFRLDTFRVRLSSGVTAPPIPFGSPHQEDYLGVSVQQCHDFLNPPDVVRYQPSPG
jgi:hypothetical protein